MTTQRELRSGFKSQKFCDFSPPASNTRLFLAELYGGAGRNDERARLMPTVEFRQSSGDAATTRNPIMVLRLFGASLATFVFGAALPAEAQFMTSFPAIIVVPPAQNSVMPNPVRTGATDKTRASVGSAEPAPKYQGRTQVDR